jgi:UDP-N-acetylglucosamine 2-epimerase (non-hydrolysing)
MSKYLVVFGTRPEAIKMAPVLQAIEQKPKLRGVSCCTGQHNELLTPILKLFGIVPDYNLRVMSPNQQLAALTSVLLTELEKVFIAEKPDRVLVQGDTTTAMVASLTACYLKIPVSHIEAGLRSHNPLEPFPEEINRRLIDDIADTFFSPTALEMRDLLREGKSRERIFVTGNTSIDALRLVSEMPYSIRGTALERLPLGSKRILLATVHRRENQGLPLRKICAAIRLISRHYRQSAHIVIPVHPNPNVRACVQAMLGDVSNITLTPPLGYQELITVARACHFALTDSGGLQEELSWLGKPALVLRNVTDRMEAIDAGAALLVGSEPETIVPAAMRLMEDDTLYQGMAQRRELFGDGTAARRIVEILNNQVPWLPKMDSSRTTVSSVTTFPSAA